MFIAYRPTQNISKIMQWLKGISDDSRFQSTPLEPLDHRNREAITIIALSLNDASKPRYQNNNMPALYLQPPLFSKAECE
jgi:REP element-mobilizing transposase RayT